MKKYIYFLTFTIMLSLQTHASIDSLIDSGCTTDQQREIIISQINSGIEINRKHSRENLSLLAHVYGKYKYSEEEAKIFYENIIMVLLKKGALVHENGKKYTSAIFRAVCYKDIKFVNIFLSFLPTMSPLETSETIKDSIGDNLMHRLLRPPLVASSEEVFEIAKMIYHHNPFVTQEKNKDEESPLDLMLSLSGYMDYSRTAKNTFLYLYSHGNQAISPHISRIFSDIHGDIDIIKYYTDL